MNYSHEQSLKFKQLVEACLYTKNYSKIAKTAYMLLKNTIISQANSLRVSSKSHSFIYEVMLHVNRIIGLKLGIKPYTESVITRTKLIEKLMEKGKGEIPLRFIKDAISLYFDLQQLPLPSRDSVLDTSTAKSPKGFFSCFNTSENESPIHGLIVHELSSREQSLRFHINTGGDDNAMKELQKISHLKACFLSNENKKIQINDSLSTDQRFIIFLAQSKAYPLLGLFFLMLTLSSLVLIQIIVNLELLAPLGTFFLMFGGGAALTLYFYLLLKRKEEEILW